VRFDGNVADNSGGAMYNQTAAPELANVIFSGNDARSGGGIENHSSNSSLVNVAFTGNSARDRGGAISNHDDSGALLANVTFSGNGANVGGAIYNDAESILAVRNSILWGNSGGQIRSNATMSTTVEYSLVAGNRIYPGTGNISGDPQFVDPDGADNTPGTADDDLRLRTSSPAIDAGNNHLVPPDTLDLDGDANASERLPLDLARRARFLDVPARPDSGGGTAPIVDMGAYETKGEAVTPMPSQTPTATPTATEPATATVTASATATSPIEATATSTATWTAVATRTSTASSIATPTATATSATPITVPTATRMATATTGPDPDDPSQLFLPLVRR
ncbi:MAG TPA: hypothetical protein VER55_09460, partial [Ardenticatenaceae bacterium]|nr:hypothetical protein [Ardenticatenaceae bacterium]